MKDKQTTRIKRAHMTMFKHPQTALYSGVMLMGSSEVVDNCPTAYTDGVNKKYGRAFLEQIPKESQIRGLVLHENLHVALKQVAHGVAMFKENRKMANLAADFVVNGIIYNITGTITGGQERIVELPEGGVHDEMFDDWSMREVYNYLKQHAKPSPKDGQGKPDKGQGGQQSNDPSGGEGQDSGEGEQEWESVTVNGKTYDLSNSDEHDFVELGDLPHDKQKEINAEIDRALREGGILAGRMGANMPRAISDLLTPKVDWREQFREFISASTRGSDEYTWRRMNKRHMANDIYLPSMENETLGRVIVAIDTSGSIGQKELNEFATELVSICDVASPESVQIIWWDDEVVGVQEFRDNYSSIKSMLKPEGGGGTKVSCVSEYINKHQITADCVVVFTDGYVESNVKWDISIPTLWMVTSSKSFEPPSGKKIMVEYD
jgi:predicted metal-dependent peptidase